MTYAPTHRLLLIATLFGAVSQAPIALAHTAPAPTANEEAQALDLAVKEIAIRSVQGDSGRAS